MPDEVVIAGPSNGQRQTVMPREGGASAKTGRVPGSSASADDGGGGCRMLLFLEQCLNGLQLGLLLFLLAAV